MGARLNTVFHSGDPESPDAVVYGHWAGDNPTDATETITAFFDAVEAQTTDKRYTDPTYLAAKFVVFLANQSRREGAEMLDFLSVGVVRNEDDCGPECIAYLNCFEMDERGRPTLTFFNREGA